jgi:hypothetical protein
MSAIKAALKRRLCNAERSICYFGDCGIVRCTPRARTLSTYGLATATMIAGWGEFTAKAERWLSVVTTIAIADGTAVGIMIGVCTAWSILSRS